MRHAIATPRRLPLRAALCTTVLGCLGAAASAQYDNQWVEFTQDNSMLSAGTISSSSNETDLAWDDLDQDGWIDLVVVRKEPFTSSGKRTNLLLMNESGVLTDRTSLYATASSVGGDNGFNTSTNDRDVNLGDFDGDGWMDVVTATTISDGDPKYIGHPRIYMNQGETGSSWNGLYYDEPRIPQLVHFGTGNPENPRFCSVAVGDLTNDGAPDLWFGDYDSSGAGGSQQPSNKDLNDRLLINDGFGYFNDESQSRMTSDMLLSAFGMASVIEDMNLDGHNDVVKDTALNPPQDVRVIYNNPSNPGFFTIQDKFHGNAPYHVNTGDLNNDGRPDVVISDDGSDRYRYNLGNDGLGRVIWGANKTFEFLIGGDDGFGSNNLIADLDGDGWNDALICDIDVDIGSYSRRLHIYHNPGGAVGAEITLKEERQSSSSSGWIGVVGMSTSSLRYTHDVAVFDIDNDGDNDMVVSRRDGTQVWRNLLDPVVTATTWTGGTSGSWGTVSNWSNGVPSSTLDAVIPSGTPNSPSTAGSSPDCDDLEVQAGAVLTVASGTDLDVHGSLTVDGSTGGAGALRLVGNPTVSAGGSSSLGNVQVDTGGTATFSGVVVDGDLELIAGTLEIDGTLEINGTATFSGGSLLPVNSVTSDLLRVDGPAVWTGTDVSAACDIDSRSSWSSGAGFAPESNEVTFRSGAIQSVSAAGSHFEDVQINAGTTLDVTSANLTLEDDLDVNGAFTPASTVRFEGSNPTALSSSALPNVQVATSGTFDTDSGVTIGGALELISGNLRLDSGLVVSGLATFSGGSLSTSAGSNVLQLDGGAAFTGTSVAAPPEIDCAGDWLSGASFTPGLRGVTFEGGGTRQVSAAGSLFNDVDVASGTTVNTTAAGLALGGALGGSGSFSGSSLVRLVGSGQTLAASPVLPNVEIQAAGTVTVTGNATVAGDLDLLGGTLRLDSDLAVQGDADFQAGTLNTDDPGVHTLTVQGSTSFSGTTGVTSPPDLRVEGDWSSSSSFQPANGAVRFARLGAQAATPSDAIFFDVEVLPGSTLTVAGGDLELSGSLSALGAINSGAILRFVGLSQVVAAGSSLPNVVIDATGGVSLGDNVGVGGTLSLLAGATTLAGDVTVAGNAAFSGGSLGTTAGANLLDLNGDASFTGTAVASPPRIAASGSWLSNASFAPGTGTVTFDRVGTQSVSATGSTFADVAIASGTTVSAPASGLRIGGDLESLGGATPGTTLTFAGTSSWSDFSGAAFGDLVIDSTGTVTQNGSPSVGGLDLLAGALQVDGEVTVGGPAALSGGSLGGVGTLILQGDAVFTGTTAIAAPTIRALGDWSANGTFAPSSGAVELEGTGQLIGLAPDFTTAFATVRFEGARSLTGDLTLDAGTIEVLAAGSIDVADRSLTIPGTTVDVDGELTVGAGGELALGGGVDLTVGSGGRLALVGTPADPARIVGHAGGGYDLAIDGTLEAGFFEFREMGAGGVELHANANLGAQPYDLRVGRFSHPSATPGSVLLTIDRNAATELRYLDFEDPLGQGSFNVKTSGAAPVTFINSVGELAGEGFDDDGSNQIHWVDLVTTLTDFEVCPGPELIKVLWSTSAEEDTAAFVVERGPSAGGPFTWIGEVLPTGPGSSYELTDAPLLAGVEVHYRLRERLTHEVERDLASGSATPWPADLPVWAKTVGAGGDYATIQAAIDAASGPLAVLLVEAGSYPAFTLDGASYSGNLHLVSDGSGAIDVDTTAGPLTIANTAFGQVVELSDIEVGSAGSPSAGLLLQSCLGPVILTDCTVTGGGGQPGVSAHTSIGVALQRSSVTGSPGVLADNFSNVSVGRGSLDSLELRGLSKAMTKGVSPTTTVEAGSTLSQFAGVMPDLAGPRLPALKQEFDLDLDLEPLTLYQLNLSIGHSYLDLNDPGFFEMPLLIDIAKFFPVVTGSSDALGQASLQLAMPPKGNLLGVPVVFQAWAISFGPVPGVHFSNVYTLHGMP